MKLKITIDMDKFLEKISGYQFLNYIIPGTLFLVLLDVLSIYDLELDNVLFLLFGGYCVGMVISRIGSLVIEGLLKKWKFVAFTPYNDFKEAVSKDSMITTLSTENNMFRTFLALFFLLLILYGLNLIPCVKDFIHTPWMVLITIVVLVVLFFFAYRKQTSYVRKSVEYILDEKKEQ